VPLFATLGNHELGADELYFQQMYGRGSFHFTFRDVAFTLLDSASATIDPRVYGSLERWLASGRDRAHVVAMHIPPFDPVGTRNAAFASRAEASRLVAQLAEANVDVTLYGHIHSFYAFANAGIPAYISGGGGAVPERLDGVGRNYATIDVDPARGRIESVGVVRID
jgi:Icc-related predicted phosphoesterase